MTNTIFSQYFIDRYGTDCIVVRLVFCMSPCINILCTTLARQYNTKYSAEPVYGLRTWHEGLCWSARNRRGSGWNVRRPCRVRGPTLTVSLSHQVQSSCDHQVAGGIHNHMIIYWWLYAQTRLCPQLDRWSSASRKRSRTMDWADVMAELWKSMSQMWGTQGEWKQQSGCEAGSCRC